MIILQPSLLFDAAPDHDDQRFATDVGPLPQGTVCLFGGQYFLVVPPKRIPKLVNVPVETCGIPTPQLKGG